ncbi:hypothetical protein HPP92_018693 [Vanilla planifolia]|uniref:SAC domain-containing protein n=1 Tax=Vanilla planifolia TaxID=51239 RepID=A0A835QEX8_VANPL|nr:hypothetical protein HPP92_018693 [Vanilla planifolia]
MAAVNFAPENDGIVSECYLEKFMLYETRSKFYMVGRDKAKTSWRVLKVDRLEPFELNICEDSTTYSESECNNLLKRINDGNKPTGGLKFVTSCYGIVGFVRFLGPYYMLLITKRRLIGDICGHNVYAVTKSAMITVPNSSIRSNMIIPKTENRYKKLLSTVDLTKDFFFSYSYHVMRSLQENLCDCKTGQVAYENMFVWNEFLTRGIRNCLKNTLWTVALVYGFFTQHKLSITGKDFRLTLIARRSRLYAGTRYLKRGVNDKGSVANDVETEQIVFEDGEGRPTQISSIVQNRGSIPLHWSQETSKMNMKPDIILQKDAHFEATRLHFKNLVKRYGNPIIILNLIKGNNKCTLTFGQGSSVCFIFDWLFHCQVTSILRIDNGLKWPDKLKDNAGLLFCKEQGNCLDRTNVAQYAYGLASLGHQLHALGLIDDPKLDLDGSLSNELMQFYERMGDTLALQYGGSAAHNKVFSERRGQWKAATQSQEFIRTLQRYYNNAYMDAEKQKAINLFLGYFKPEQDKVVIWEMDSDQHYFASKHNNSLGIETPRSIIKRSLSVGSILQQNKMHLSHCCINNGEFPKSVLFDKTHEARGARRLCDSTPEISAYQRDMAFSRSIPMLPCRHLFVESKHGFLSELAFDASTLSNFVDLDRLSSSTNSCEEAYERSTAGSTVTILSTECCVNGFATDAIPSVKGDDRTIHSTNELSKEMDQNKEFSDSFVNWVIYGETMSSR